MASMYAKYILERTNDMIVETPNAYALYRFLDDGKTVYIIDIYVEPEFRKSNVASDLADTIVRKAKEMGAKKLIGSVVPSTNNSTISMKVLLGYGMSLDSSTNDLIIFKKDI